MYRRHVQSLPAVDPLQLAVTSAGAGQPVRQAVNRGVKQLFDWHARQHTAAVGRWRGQAQLLFQHPLRTVIVPHQPAACVDGNQIIRADLHKRRFRTELQYPVVTVPVLKPRIFYPLRTEPGELQRQLLTGFWLRRGQRRDVEDGVKLSLGIEQRHRRTGERDVGGIEMVIMMDGQRFSGCQRRADRTGARPGLRPVCAQKQPGATQADFCTVITVIVDRHPRGIRQQQDIARRRNLPVERLQAVTGNMAKLLQLLAVLTQLMPRQDPRRLHPAGIQPVMVDTALPRVKDRPIVLAQRQGRGVLADGGGHGGDMFTLAMIQDTLLRNLRGGAVGWQTLRCRRYLSIR